MHWNKWATESATATKIGDRKISLVVWREFFLWRFLVRNAASSEVYVNTVFQNIGFTDEQAAKDAAELWVSNNAEVLLALKDE
jgi:hypothetical protein